jgi:hypothetical protein
MKGQPSTPRATGDRSAPGELDYEFSKATTNTGSLVEQYWSTSPCQRLGTTVPVSLSFERYVTDRWLDEDVTDRA